LTVRGVSVARRELGVLNSLAQVGHRGSLLVRMFVWGRALLGRSLLTE